MKNHDNCENKRNKLHILIGGIVICLVMISLLLVQVKELEQIKLDMLIELDQTEGDILSEFRTTQGNMLSELRTTKLAVLEVGYEKYEIPNMVGLKSERDYPVLELQSEAMGDAYFTVSNLESVKDCRISVYSDGILLKKGDVDLPVEQEDNIIAIRHINRSSTAFVTDKSYDKQVQHILYVEFLGKNDTLIARTNTVIYTSLKDNPESAEAYVPKMFS